MTKPETKYDIAREFSAGFCAALLPAPRSLSESDHWLSGYDAGYGLRGTKNEKLNGYLRSIGCEAMAIVRPAGSSSGPKRRK